MSDSMKISSADLHSPQVDEYVELQSFLRKDPGPINDRPWIVRVIFANWFYLALAGGAGGFTGWLLLEPFFDDNFIVEGEFDLAAALLFPVTAAFVGLFLGSAEGLICRNPLRALKSSAVGLAVGFIGGFIALIPTGIVFGIMSGIALSMMDNPVPGEMPGGMALLILMMGRAAGWSIISIPAGIGQGIALKEKKVIVNGLVGAMLGGLIGGLLFDPISLVLISDDGQATYSRAVGLTTVGIFVGLFIGLVEGWTKTAWVLMQKGPLAGKQFIIYKDTTILGSSPKADIYLFKDDAIEPRHAMIVNRGGRFEIEDCSTPDGTYVNGIPVTHAVLQDKDQIVLGKTVLEFSFRENTN